jgi:hypothetical protein
MPADTLFLIALPAFAAFIALPALLALRRRRATREASDVAVALAEFAAAARRDLAQTDRCQPLGADLAARAQRLRFPEFASLQLVQDLPRAPQELLADTAQRLALRLRRRIAFERKMLARTASGRRRGALAAIIPPLALLVLQAFGLSIPAAMLAFVICLEALGCWLLWQLARVTI